MVDLRRVRALGEVAERGTIAAAADALHLTPSAVSQQLAALEREVGIPLLEPAGRSIRLTAAAYVLLEHSGPLFAQLERLRAELDAHAVGDAGEVRIGAFPTAIAALLAPAVADLRRRAPRIRLRVTELETAPAVEALVRREIDLAVGMECTDAPRPGDARFHRRDLLRDVLDVAVAHDHPLVRHARVPLAGWSCDQVVQTACQGAGFTPLVEHRTTDWNAALALVGAGLGVTLVPRLAQLAPMPGVRMLELAGDAPARHLIGICRGGAEHAPAIAAVLAALERVAAGSERAAA